MSKLIYFIAAFMAFVVMYVSVTHLLTLQSYSSSDLVLALLILSIIINWSGGLVGKNSQEKPSV